MSDARKIFIEHIEEEIARQEQQAEWWERPEVLAGEDISGTIIKKEEQAEKHRMRARELRELRYHAMKAWMF